MTVKKLVNVLPKYIGCVALTCLVGHASVLADDTKAQFDCLIEPNVVAAVGSPVQGVLDETLVDRGDFVKQGQVIARLKASSEIASFEYAKARADMTSEISAREADLRLARINLKRQAELKRQGLAPAQKYDEAKARQEIAEASLSQAQENAQLLLLEQEQAEQRVEERTIRSPVDGVVVEQQTFPGEFVYDNSVMTIAQIHPLRVEVVIPARLFNEFRRGDTARIDPELGSEKELVGVVDVVDRVLDTRSGTYGIRLNLPNEDLSIPGGQKCRLSFESKISELTR